MIYINKHFNSGDEWESFYSSFEEKAENCYLRWINCDDTLSLAEEKLAIEWQDIVEADEPDILEIVIPPEHDISSEEFEAFIKIAHKIQKSGIANIITAVLGLSGLDDYGHSMEKKDDKLWGNTH